MPGTTLELLNERARELEVRFEISEREDSLA